jgi:hypothetical protein
MALPVCFIPASITLIGGNGYFCYCPLTIVVSWAALKLESPLMAGCAAIAAWT